VTFSVLDPARDADALAGFMMKTTWEPDNDAWFRWFVDWWNGPGAWDALPTETAQAFRDRGEKLFHEVRTLAADTTGAAGFRAITAPVLVMTGSRTPLAEQRTVQRLVEALPHATMRRFDGMGHMGPITHHAIVDAAIAEFLTAAADRS
jgi:pimeloyl-ACP methyl ester carboxylesterase